MTVLWRHNFYKSDQKGAQAEVVSQSTYYLSIWSCAVIWFPVNVLIHSLPALYRLAWNWDLFSNCFWKDVTGARERASSKKDRFPQKESVEGSTHRSHRRWRAPRSGSLCTTALISGRWRRGEKWNGYIITWGPGINTSSAGRYRLCQV